MKRVQSKYKHTRRFSKQAEHLLLTLVVLLIVFVPTIFAAQYRHVNELQIWFFDVGQGDSTFIQTPEGKQILIDGGPDNSVLQKLASVMLPWDRAIDAIVITHPDADHITGLVSVLEHYEVGMVIETGARGTTPVIKALDQAVQDEQTNHRLVKANDVIKFENLSLLVDWPEQTYENQKPDDRNNTSIVLTVLFGDTRVLLTGDAEEESEKGMRDVLEDVDVLKVGHHGSVSSSSVSFLNEIQPEISVISVGEDNRYGHPHPVVLQRLSEIHSEIFRTDFGGDILLTSSGGKPTIVSSPLPF